MRHLGVFVAAFALALAIAAIAYGAGVAAVEGVSQSTGNAGYLGSTTFGVRGYATGNSTGVIGQSGSGSGVRGLSSGAGVSGFSTGSGSTHAGVYGECDYCPGLEAYSYTNEGVLAFSDGTLSQNPDTAGIAGVALRAGIGVYGEAPTTGWAGYFNGDVRINGVVSPALITSQIDHPVDPANKVLSFGYLATPDYKVVHDGTVTLDSNGEAIVDVPAWFEVATEDYRYQLTPIGESAQLYVAEEIKDGKFRIAGGYPEMRASWQVVGIRRDPYAQSRALIVEQEKAGLFRGRLLHPEVYGRPQSEALDGGRRRASNHRVPARARVR